MVRLAQEWNVRYTLVDGQGNFGSIDGDPAAAYRYTEARLTREAESILVDLDKETVDFRENYDGSTAEPTVLPSKLPNLLVNGASGIAVGMATNIPDFPTGGIISRDGIREAYATGRGSIRMRARVRIEERDRKTAIVVTEIPYQVNKTSLIQTAAKLVRDKKIEDISTIRDESDRQGMRIVFELKRSAHPEVVLHQLYKYTQLQSNFSVNNVVIVDGGPQLVNLKQMMELFLDHRREVVTRRTRFELEKANERAHVLQGYLKALDHLDEVIRVIRASSDAAEARRALMGEHAELKITLAPGKDLGIALYGDAELESSGGVLRLTEVQAQAVLDMRLQRLTGLEREKLVGEYRDLVDEIAQLERILGDELELAKVIRAELVEVREAFGDGRRTSIADLSDDISKEDLIAEEHMVVTLTRGGYIKRTALSSYRAQSRGGRGVSSQRSKEDDVNSLLLVGSTHDYLLFFTDRGRVYREKIYDLPEAERAARGSHVRNILPLEDDESVQTVLSIKDFDADGYFVFATRQGLIKRTAIREYGNINAAGLIAINIVEGDELVAVRITEGEADIVLATRDGQSIRFAEDEARDTGRATQGVIGIKLRDDDYVVSLAVIAPEDKESAELLAVSELGYGKRTPLSEYPTQGRGGYGVITLNVTDKTGPLVSLNPVLGEEELFVLSEGGILIRTHVHQVSTYKRASQGVTIMKIGGGDRVVSALVMLAEEKLDEAVNEKGLTA